LVDCEHPFPLPACASTPKNSTKKGIFDNDGPPQRNFGDSRVPVSRGPKQRRPTQGQGELQYTGERGHAPLPPLRLRALVAGDGEHYLRGPHPTARAKSLGRVSLAHGRLSTRGISKRHQANTRTYSQQLLFPNPANDRTLPAPICVRAGPASGEGQGADISAPPGHRQVLGGAPGTARGASVGDGEGWGRGAVEAPEGNRMGRFEMLYQDVRDAYQRMPRRHPCRLCRPLLYWLPDVPRLPRCSVLALLPNSCTPTDPEVYFPKLYDNSLKWSRYALSSNWALVLSAASVDVFVVFETSFFIGSRLRYGCSYCRVNTEAGTS